MYVRMYVRMYVSLYLKKHLCNLIQHKLNYIISCCIILNIEWTDDNIEAK